MIRDNLRGMRKSFRDIGTSIFLDRTRPRRTTVLYSSGRSGSTWLSELLHSIPGTRLVFEPFHPRHGLKELADFRYRYVPPGDSIPLLDDTYSAVLSGSRTTPWIEQLNKPWSFVYTSRIVKLVRVNLLVPWLVQRHPDHRYILLLRHPAAVVLSQLRKGWQLSSARIKAQGALLEQPAISALEKFGWPTSGFLSNLVFWAAENSLAIEHALASNSMIVFYEELCSSPDLVLDEIGDYLDTALPANASSSINRVSWSSDAEVASMSVVEKISRWTEDLSEQQKIELSDVLHTSGLNRFYSLDPMPEESAINFVRDHNRRIRTIRKA
jgi:hypothetical protein